MTMVANSSKYPFNRCRLSSSSCGPLLRSLAKAVGTLALLALLFLLPSRTLAQQPWNYSNLSEAHLDDAYLLEPSVDIKHKLQRAKVNAPYNRLYRLVLHTHSRGRHTLSFHSDSVSFTLPENLAQELFPYLVSDRYWRQRFATLQNWAFVRFDNGRLLDVDSTDHRYGPFSSLDWLSYSYQPSAEWPVVFSVRTNTRTPQTLTLPALQRLAEWGAFVTMEGQYAYEQNLAIQRQKQAHDQQQLQHQLDSLDRVSSLFAQRADSITVVLQQDSADLAEQRLMAQVQETKERMNREQIFLMSINPARSDYMFGLEFNFYNCFSKIITKLEITVTPVNERNQVQKDQFNRDVRTIRCMGPIRPGSPAQYTFDELFWDDKGRIKFMRVTSITFHFTDGTRKNFYGYNQILKHTLNP